MSRVAFDAHAHIYPCYDLSRLFGHALARARQRGGAFHLLLAEGSDHRYFRALRDLASRGPNDRAPRPRVEEHHTAGDSANRTVEDLPGLRVESTQEPSSLRVRPEAGDDAVYLVAGRQLISLERIEVLLLGLEPEQPLYERQDLRDPATVLLHQGLEAGAMAVLPWSVGKWMGRRGRRVAELASMPTLAGNPLFFLGDILARSWPWPRPASFDGPSRVLAGTDTLPLPGAERGIGSYHSEVQGTIDPGRPWGSLLEILRSGGEIRAAGRRSRAVPAMLDQVRLRLRAGRYAVS